MMMWKVILWLTLFVSLALAGCRVSGVASTGAVSEWYYPTKEGKDQWDDPYRSRAASSDVAASGHTRPPVPKEVD